MMHNPAVEKDRTAGTLLGKPIGYPMNWFEFRRYLLILLGLAHEAIMYLGAAVNVEEQESSTKFIPQFPVQALDSSYFELLNDLPG